MGFSRQPVLERPIELKLRQELKEKWSVGLTAPKIAEALNFGIKGSPYEKLKTYHVWFYRHKFNEKDKKDETWQPGQFPKRRKGAIRKGSSRYKVKHDEPMPFKVFQDALNQNCPKLGPYSKRKRAYLILHYWTPLRKSEIYERVAEDFEIKKDILKINLYRKKKFYRVGEKTEPFYLSLKMPLVEEVVEWVEDFEPDERPFRFTHTTAWNYVKEVFKGYYPHFFRFDYITKAVENARDVRSIIVELLNDTGLDLATVTTYIMSNPKYRTSVNERELEILKAEGMLK